ncbi:TFAP4 isoform 3 [Pan troglodytes]|uniref:Transcription factor AP-4 n=3 Tax=Hominidae TaxID=9604 RepID=I3L4L6_HUMAN|nr:TFAP4 isoform 3 [Pan troglodytes]PNJ16707.1 TFAP4 isoform 3 [Pongo abelii]
MEYFMVPTQKVPSLQHFRKTEKEVIGGLCRCARWRPTCTRKSSR